MNTEQERAEFEAWYASRHETYDTTFIYYTPENRYQRPSVDESWSAYQAGRAALQSQTIPASDWFDMFMELARSVVVANRLFAVSPTTTKHKVAADAAIALQEHARKHPALQSQDREDAERYRWLRKHWFTMTSCYDGGRVEFTTGQPRYSSATEANVDEAIDHARRIEENK